jgi:NADH-quinone oxidoreductase subunit H
MVTILLTVLTSLLAIAFFTIAERKLLASIQRRKWPDVTGFWGILQAFADGLKLILKEVIIPTKSNWVLFLLAPILSLVIGLSMWALIPFTPLDYLTNFDYSLLWVYSISSLGIYGIIGAGWASNSKYAFLGGLRSAAQLISYEVSIILLVLPVAACANSFNLVTIVEQQRQVWFFIPLFPVACLFFISILA